MDWLLLASGAVILTGLSKAGFGGGTGILATPIMSMALPPRIALGVLLPLLILSDWISIYAYRKTIAWKPLLWFLPAALGGIAAGAWVLGSVDDRMLKFVIGLICLGFCLLKLATRGRGGISGTHHAPAPALGVATGATAGVVSTLAHAAGPVAAIYLLPMGMSPALYMGTTTVCFTAINLAKLPFYLGQDAITAETLHTTLLLVPAMIAGTLLGLWSNRHLSKELFTKIAYVCLFVTGAYLSITNYPW